MTDLIVNTQVKESLETNVSSEFYDELDEKVQEILHEAEERAQENGRSTVFPRDL